MVNGRGKGKRVGVDGVQVFLDSNENGAREANEPIATSASGGFYVFNGIAAGRYRVRPTDPNGWHIFLKKGILRPVIVRPKPQRKPGRVRPLVLLAAT